MKKLLAGALSLSFIGIVKADRILPFQSHVPNIFLASAMLDLGEPNKNLFASAITMRYEEMGSTSDTLKHWSITASIDEEDGIETNGITGKRATVHCLNTLNQLTYTGKIELIYDDSSNCYHNTKILTGPAFDNKPLLITISTLSPIGIIKSDELFPLGRYILRYITMHASTGDIQDDIQHAIVAFEKEEMTFLENSTQEFEQSESQPDHSPQTETGSDPS